MRRVTLIFLLSFILLGTSLLVYHVKSVVEIDGHLRLGDMIDPPSAPVIQNGNIFTFTDDVLVDHILIAKGNITIDGAGHTVQSRGNSPIGIDIGIYPNRITIKNLTIKGFTKAIYLGVSTNNTIFNCVIEDNIMYGIELIVASHNNISYNEIRDSHTAIGLGNSFNNTIVGNNLVNNLFAGIATSMAFNNTISGNTVMGGNFGMAIDTVSNNNTIDENTIISSNFGIYISDSAGNKFTHNSFIGNSLSFLVIEPNFVNFWDNDCEGNYWSDYEERYPNASYDEFGIWNMSYSIDENNTDNHPLRSPYWNPADTNHDLLIDIFDVVLVVSYYNTYWKPECCHIDIAEPYGIINIFDIVMICSSYGEEYTP